MAKPKADSIEKPGHVCNERCSEGYNAVYFALCGSTVAGTLDLVRNFLNQHNLHDLTFCPDCDTCGFAHSADCKIGRAFENPRLTAYLANARQEITELLNRPKPEKISKPQ